MNEPELPFDGQDKHKRMVVRVPAGLALGAFGWPTGQQPRARVEHPETSHEAAASVRSIGPRMAAVLAVMRRIGRPAMDEEIEAAYLAQPDLPRQGESGIRSRRADLVKAGLVVDSGQRALKPSGRRSILWQAARPS